MKKNIARIIAITIACAVTGLIFPLVSNAGIFDNPSDCAPDQVGVADDIKTLADLTKAFGPIFVASPNAGDIAAKLARKLFEDRSALGLPDRGAAAQVLKGQYADALSSLNDYIAGLDKTKIQPGTEDMKQLLRDAAVKLQECVSNLAASGL